MCFFPIKVGNRTLNAMCTTLPGRIRNTCFRKLNEELEISVQKYISLTGFRPKVEDLQVGVFVLIAISC